VLFFYSPRRTSGEIAKFRGFVGCVPALKYHFEFGGKFVCSVNLEPVRFHHAPTQRSRGLLILSTKVVFALGFTKVIQHFQRFPLGMQGFARTTLKAPRSIPLMAGNQDTVQRRCASLDRRDRRRLPRYRLRSWPARRRLAQSQAQGNKSGVQKPSPHYFLLFA
jgi:hypothetical protein